MPNRRRIGYMPNRRFDKFQNPERAGSKSARLARDDDRERKARADGERGADAPYEEWTVKELRAQAREKSIRGFSRMNRDQLIFALRGPEPGQARPRRR